MSINFRCPVCHVQEHRNLRIPCSGQYYAEFGITRNMALNLRKIHSFLPLYLSELPEIHCQRSVSRLRRISSGVSPSAFIDSIGIYTAPFLYDIIYRISNGLLAARVHSTLKPFFLYPFLSETTVYIPVDFQLHILSIVRVLLCELYSSYKQAHEKN